MRQPDPEITDPESADLKSADRISTPYQGDGALLENQGCEQFASSEFDPPWDPLDHAKNIQRTLPAWVEYFRRVRFEGRYAAYRPLVAALRCELADRGSPRDTWRYDGVALHCRMPYTSAEITELFDAIADASSGRLRRKVLALASYAASGLGMLAGFFFLVWLAGYSLQHMPVIPWR